RLEIDELEELEEDEPQAPTGGPPGHPLGTPLHAPEWEHEHSAAEVDEPRADERLEHEPRDRGRAPAADEDRTERPEQQEAGVLDIVPDGFGFLRVAGLGRSREDVYVPRAVVRELGLRKGDEVAGAVRRG